MSRPRDYPAIRVLWRPGFAHPAAAVSRCGGSAGDAGVPLRLGGPSPCPPVKGAEIWVRESRAYALVAGLLVAWGARESASHKRQWSRS